MEETPTGAAGVADDAAADGTAAPAVGAEPAAVETPEA